jgi:hypothetical protein
MDLHCFTTAEVPYTIHLLRDTQRSDKAIVYGRVAWKYEREDIKNEHRIYKLLFDDVKLPLIDL